MDSRNFGNNYCYEQSSTNYYKPGRTNGSRFTDTEANASSHGKASFNDYYDREQPPNMSDHSQNRNEGLSNPSRFAQQPTHISENPSHFSPQPFDDPPGPYVSSKAQRVSDAPTPCPSNFNYHEAWKKELDPDVKKLRNMAWKIQTSQPKFTVKGTLHSAASHVPVEMELTNQKEKGFLRCSVFIHGILISSSGESTKVGDARRNAYEDALKNLLMPHLRVVKTNPNSKELEASMTPFPSGPPTMDGTSSAINTCQLTLAEENWTLTEFNISSAYEKECNVDEATLKKKGQNFMSLDATNFGNSAQLPFPSPHGIKCLAASYNLPKDSQTPAGESTMDSRHFPQTQGQTQRPPHGKKMDEIKLIKDQRIVKALSESIKRMVIPGMPGDATPQQVLEETAKRNGKVIKISCNRGLGRGRRNPGCQVFFGKELVGRGSGVDPSVAQSEACIDALDRLRQVCQGKQTPKASGDKDRVLPRESFQVEGSASREYPTHDGSSGGRPRGRKDVGTKQPDYDDCHRHGLTGVDKEGDYDGRNRTDIGQGFGFDGRNRTDVGQGFGHGGRNRMDIGQGFGFDCGNRTEIDKRFDYDDRNKMQIDQQFGYDDHNKTEIDQQFGYDDRNKIQIDQRFIYDGRNNRTEPHREIDYDDRKRTERDQRLDYNDSQTRMETGQRLEYDGHKRMSDSYHQSSSSLSRTYRHGYPGREEDVRDRSNTSTSSRFNKDRLSDLTPTDSSSKPQLLLANLFTQQEKQFLQSQCEKLNLGFNLKAKGSGPERRDSVDQNKDKGSSSKRSQKDIMARSDHSLPNSARFVHRDSDHRNSHPGSHSRVEDIHGSHSRTRTGDDHSPYYGSRSRTHTEDRRSPLHGSRSRTRTEDRRSPQHSSHSRTQDRRSPQHGSHSRTQDRRSPQHGSHSLTRTEDRRSPQHGSHSRTHTEHRHSPQHGSHSRTHTEHRHSPQHGSHSRTHTEDHRSPQHGSHSRTHTEDRQSIHHGSRTYTEDHRSTHYGSHSRPHSEDDHSPRHSTHSRHRPHPEESHSSNHCERSRKSPHGFRSQTHDKRRRPASDKEDDIGPEKVRRLYN